MIERSSFNNNILYFYIDEGERTKIDKIDFSFNENKITSFLDNETSEFIKKIKKNNYYYSKSLIDEYLDLYNSILVSNNIHNINIEAVFTDYDNKLTLSFVLKEKDPIVVNKITIIGENCFYIYIMNIIKN